LTALAAVFSVGMLLTGISCNRQNTEDNTVMTKGPTESPDSLSDQSTAARTEVATFGAGCFWCVEAVFLQLEGVTTVESGYCGGTIENPTYEQICTGTTGHAEVCQIRYDPSKITFDELLEVFWKTHDPTTRNRQGNDMGPQYRSVVFYHDDRQKTLAEERKRQLDAAGIWQDPIVTEISPYTKFYKAEEYHQQYYDRNPEAGYCQFIIRPKVDKVRDVFKDKLRKDK
jgi:peptide-methionine (S)-S-oxide reductase